MNWRAIILLVIIIKSAFAVSYCCSDPNVSSSCQAEIQAISCCSANQCGETTDVAELPNNDTQDTSSENSTHCSCVHISPMTLDFEAEEKIIDLVSIEKNEVNHYVSPYSYLYSSKIFQPPRCA